MASSGGWYDALVEDDPEELYETAPCGYVSTLPTGGIVKANRTFMTWTGYDARALYGERRIQDLLPVGDRIFYETHFAPSLALQGHVREIAVEIVCASGERIPVLLNAVTKVDGHGNPTMVRIAVFDARERRSYEQELLEARRVAERAAEEAQHLAQILQRTLLPPDLPDIPWLDLGGAYRPAGDGSVVGGDFYDVFQTATDTWGVAIGDVCGKGAEAAVTTALARYTIRAGAIRSDRPSDVLAPLHDAVALSDARGFVTAVYLTARRTGDHVRLRFSAGGHHLPLLVTPAGDVETVGTPGSFLGLLGPPRLADTDVDLEPGAALVLFTDGVIEARAGDVFFGEDRLVSVLAANAGRPAQETADAVANAAITFQQGDTRDDIAVVVIAAPS